MINKIILSLIPKMKLSFFFVLITIIGFLMMAHINCHQKRQESEGSDEDGPFDMSMSDGPSKMRPDGQTR